MLAILFAAGCVVILVVAFNKPKGPPDAPSPVEPRCPEAIAAAAAKRHPRPSVTWEPRLRSEPSDGWSRGELDAAAWAHAKHYND